MKFQASPFRLKFAFLASTHKTLLKVAFSVGAVLLGSSGHLMSFNTTVDGGESRFLKGSLACTF
jgi:hypothetical protein